MKEPSRSEHVSVKMGYQKPRILEMKSAHDGVTDAWITAALVGTTVTTKSTVGRATSILTPGWGHGPLARVAHAHAPKWDLNKFS